MSFSRLVSLISIVVSAILLIINFYKVGTIDPMLLAMFGTTISAASGERITGGLSIPNKAATALQEAKDKMNTLKDNEQ